MKSRLIWLVCVVFSTSKIARANKEGKDVKIPLDYHFKIGLSNNFETARANKEGKDVKIPLDYTPRLAWAIMKVLIQPMLESKIEFDVQACWARNNQRCYIQLRFWDVYSACLFTTSSSQRTISTRNLLDKLYATKQGDWVNSSECLQF